MVPTGETHITGCPLYTLTAQGIEVARGSFSNVQVPPGGNRDKGATAALAVVLIGHYVGE